MADKKRLFQPQLKEKWLYGMEPLEPVPEGPHCKRWYKTMDKVTPNSLAKHRNRILKYPMDSRWLLSVREGLDNFRMGYLPADNLFIPGHREGFLSTAARRVPQPPPRKTQNKLPKGDLFSRLSPALKAQKAFIEELKASLKPHPSADYPDLKKVLPPELLLKVLGEIDPDRKLEDTWAYCEVMKDRKKSPTKVCEKHPEEINPEPSEPSQPGTSQLTQPGTSQPSQPGTSRPIQPGTSWPIQPGTSQPSQPGTSGPSQPGLPNQVNRDLPSESTRDLPAKLSWEQLVKSSWDLLAKSTRNSRPSQPVPPCQVNQGPPKQVKRRLRKQVNRGPPKQGNRGLPKQVNQEPPKHVNRGCPRQANREPPKQVTLEPPDQDNQGPDNQGPPDQLNQESPGQVAPEPPGQDTPGDPDEVNQRSPKESFLSYLMQLLPEEKKKKKSRKKRIPKHPNPYVYTEDEVSEFYKCTDDTFGDMDTDEKFITEQFEIDEKYTPNDNMGEIKKVTQVPVDPDCSKELDDTKEREFALQEGNWERNLRKPPDPYRPKWVKPRYGEWYLNPKTSKKQMNDEPWVGSRVLEEQKYQSHARDLEPDILDDLYGPIAFKDFIVSKGYRMPGVIEKLFMRKKWTYDSVKTPVDRVVKLLSKVPDDTSDDTSEDD